MNQSPQSHQPDPVAGIVPSRLPHISVMATGRAAATTTATTVLSFPPRNDLPLTTPPIQTSEAPCFPISAHRQLSASPPPVFSYTSYSQVNPYGPTYGQSSPLYHHSPSFQNANTPAFHDLSSFPGDYSPAPVKKVYAADEEILSPFSMSYANMAGIDLGPNLHPVTESKLPVKNPPRWP